MNDISARPADRAGGPSALSPSGSQSETLIPRASRTPIVERLRMIRGTQFTPLENELVGEAADTISELLEALKALAQFHDSGGHIGNADGVIERARVIVAKAQGETAS